jgi:hypothetical protein
MAASHDTFTRQLCCVGLSLPVAISGAYYLKETIRLRRWVQVRATVLSFQTKGAIVNQEAEMRYSYEVRGKKYEGTRITISDWVLAAGAWHVERLRKRYPVGSDAAVWYDPLRPELSVLRRPGYTLAVATLLLGLGGGGYMFWSIGEGWTMPPTYHPPHPIHFR